MRLDLHSLLPRFVLVESAKAADSIRAAQVCAGVKPGEIVIFDRAYVDFVHLGVLNEAGVHWVTRSKEGLCFRVVKKLPKGTDKRILRDDLVVLKNPESRANYPHRLRRVRALVENEDIFLANYADTLTDAPLDELVARFRRAPNAVASMLAVPPVSTHHLVDIADSGEVTGVRPVSEMMQWENGGYFVMRPGIFDVLREGEDMVPQAFARLVPQRQLLAQRYDGFWRAADTFKDRAELEDMFHRGQCPWMLWDPHRGGGSPLTVSALIPEQPSARDTDAALTTG